MSEKTEKVMEEYFKGVVEPVYFLLLSTASVGQETRHQARWKEKNSLVLAKSGAKSFIFKGRPRCDHHATSLYTRLGGILREIPLRALRVNCMQIIVNFKLSPNFLY